MKDRGATGSTAGSIATGARKGDKKEESQKCGECKRVVVKNSMSVRCEHCLLWFHCACENISDESYKIL